MVQLSTAIAFFAALGAGMMAGLFFAFSNSVMPALARLQPAQGVTAMNHINTIIQNPLFFVFFMGTALLSLLALVDVFIGWSPNRLRLLAGAALYLGGCILVTIAINVPMNNALAAVAADSAEAAKLWEAYLDRWVFWNHVRAIACTLSMAAFVAALI